MSESMPKITVVTITYNAEKYIEKTIQSVLEQQYQNIEYIIIDGQSQDNTLGIIEKYKNKIEKVVSEKDSGIYDAMNKGLSLATGTWVNFLNAGDTYYSLFTLSEVFDKLPSDIKLVYGDWINVDNNGLCRHIKSNPKLDLKELAYKFQMNHQALFVKNENLPFYDTTYKIKADYQWIVDIVKNLDESQIKYIEKALVKYDLEGMSAKFLMTNMKEYMRLTSVNFGFWQTILNTPIYSKYLIKYMLSQIKKRG